MTLLLKQLFAFFRLLNSENGTNQIAAGLALGIMLGFAPFISIQTFLILALVFVFRIQLGAVFISAFFFKFVAYLIDPIADRLGRLTLETDSLKPLFTTMYNMPLVPMTRFNNSIVMGSLIFSLILAPFAFIIFKLIILKYRATIVERFKATKFWKAFTATKFYAWYTKYDDLYNV